MPSMFAIALWLVAAPAPQVEIIRDEWGVPRISGASIEAVSYACGYAQAEDRLDEILRNYLRAEGRYASISGEASIEEDYREFTALGAWRWAAGRYGTR